MDKLTKLYPMVQFAKNTWEIDEFDAASIFLLVGEEKAMVIDCGMGIGDLRGAVEMITDKPLVCVITHGHIDHTGNIRQFEEAWMNPKDNDKEFPENLERRKFDTYRIAQRNKGSIGAPFNMFQLYPYDIDVDLRGPESYDKVPVIHDLTDGMTFDLGGRIVTAYECPGHTAGEMVLIDSQTRIMFCGDALNFNLNIGAVPVETTLKALKRIQSMNDQYDCIMNGHHDFRALGMPLDEDCLTNVIALCEEIMEGHYSDCQFPSFWGQALKLGKQEGGFAMAPISAPELIQPPKWGRHAAVRKGRNFLGFNPDKIHE